MVSDALSYYPRLIFWSILIQNWRKTPPKNKQCRSKFRGGARLLRPLWIRRWIGSNDDVMSKDNYKSWTKWFNFHCYKWNVDVKPSPVLGLKWCKFIRNQTTVIYLNQYSKSSVTIKVMVLDDMSLDSNRPHGIWLWQSVENGNFVVKLSCKIPPVAIIVVIIIDLRVRWPWSWNSNLYRNQSCFVLASEFYW